MRAQLERVVRRAAVEAVAGASDATSDDVARAAQHMDTRQAAAPAVFRQTSLLPRVVPFSSASLESPAAKTGESSRTAAQAYAAVVARASSTRLSYADAATVSSRMRAALLPANSVAFSEGSGSARLGTGTRLPAVTRPVSPVSVGQVASPELLAEHVARRVTFGWGAYDLHVMQGTAPEGERRITFSAGTMPAAAHGIQKLVGQVAMLLLTRLGSDVVDEKYGSTFLAQTYGRDVVAGRLGVLRTLDDVRLRWQRGAAAGLPDDERLVSLTLEDMRTASGAVYARVRVTSAAGSQREISMPVVNPEVRYGY